MLQWIKILILLEQSRFCNYLIKCWLLNWRSMYLMTLFVLKKNFMWKMISNFPSLYMIFRHSSIPLDDANSNASPRTSLRVMQSRSCRMQNVFSLLFVYQTGVGLTGWLVGLFVVLSGLWGLLARRHGRTPTLAAIWPTATNSWQ